MAKNTKYYQAVLLYLSYLFADTEEDSRYPSSTGKSTFKIADSYNEDIQVELAKSRGSGVIPWQGYRR